MHTIGQILTAAFPAVLKTMRNGRNWVDPQLQRYQDEGRILVRELAPLLQVRGQLIPVSEISIPAIWTEQDERRNQTEAQKVNLVKALLENWLYSHDDLVLDKMSEGGAVVSKQYHYNIGDVMDIVHEDGSKSHVVKLYTAIAFVR